MAITADKISFAYSQKTVVENFSVSLGADDFVMLLGANGSGKSTVIKLLGGFLKGHEGEIRLNGEKLSSVRSFERARKIAVVSQTQPPVLDFSVYEMVMMGRFCHDGRLNKPAEADRKIVAEVMQEMEITDFAGRRVRELSGGERQRVMLAKALAQQPEYLLLDEPTAALDPAHSLKLMEFLKSLKGKIGILMVCHDLNLAWNYADDVIILQNGRTVFSGRTNEVMSVENIRKSFGCGAIIHPDEGIILQK